MKLTIPRVVATYLIRRAMETPYSPIGEYMFRYWLVPYRRQPQDSSDVGVGPVSFWRRPIAWLFQQFDIAIRVHNIRLSDYDRALHDHPFSYLTIILDGGYFEITHQYERGVYIGDKKTWYGPGTVLWRRAESLHRLVIPDGTEAWTLFISGLETHEWGFETNPEHKMLAADYFRTKEYKEGRGAPIAKSFCQNCGADALHVECGQTVCWACGRGETI